MAFEVVFVGVSPASPGAGEESTCFVINGNILVDTGWNAALSMQSHDLLPTDIDHVFISENDARGHRSAGSDRKQECEAAN